MSRSRLLRRVSLLLGSSLGAVDCATYEYGVLMTSYDISGKVVDATSGTGIPGVQVETLGTTTTSEADGTWALSTFDAEACASDPCAVTATDIDGADNGAYADGQASFTTSPDETGEGAREVTDILIELEPTTPDTGD